MLKDIPIDEITRVIGLATAPAFLLGAVAGLLSLLNARLEAIMAWSRKLHAIDKDDEARNWLRADIPRTKRRGRVTETAIGLCAFCGIVTGWMVVLVFVDALFGLQNSRAVAVMFIGAMTLLTTALFALMHEVRLSMGGCAHQDL
ncbi:DUF2721 domain-containing protein [Hansschlegelia quercus]|uniref:DUF2721 domain-containing protein n=1 Tax=Hansschlegelia quercus TaxID=2528245 RepID=A0A4Q9GHH9_9HYPH|nr:DUF2721 domain-containing protein [Hansschlegelia quercus]TBN53502.1 DUF2721 domain-containing protein [Hansschlegelia quercus]